MATNKTTIDEFVTRIKNNTPLVYEKGKTEGVEEGFDAGKQAERDDFWKEYYTTSSWAYAFYGSMWSDKNYNPHKTIKPSAGTSAAAMYQTSTITDTKVPLDLSGVNSINYIFYNAKQLKTICDITFPASGTTSNAFTGCSALENITVSGSTQISLVFTSCTKLNKTSIESIINALSDEKEGLTLTLSKAAVDTAFETVKGAADGSTSAEWIALAGNENTEGIKPKWNISLITT